MKKLALMGFILLLVGTVAFAEIAFAPAVSISGNATLTWGIDLDTRYTGFSNAATSAFKIALVGSSSDAKGSEEDGTVYGYIKLSGIALTLSSGTTVAAATAVASTAVIVDDDADGTIEAAETATVTNTLTTSKVIPALAAPSVEAYVVLGPVDWLIYAAPDLKVSFAKPIEADDAGTVQNVDADGVLPDFGTYGTGFRFKNDMLTIIAKVASDSDWTSATNYGVGLSANIKVAPLTVDLGYVMPFGAGTNIGFGAKVALAVAPLSLTVAFDGNYTTAFAYELTANVGLTLTDLMNVTAGFAMASSGWDKDAEVGIDLKAVPNLTAKVDFGLYDLTASLEWAAVVNLGYKIMMGDTNYIKPSVILKISSDAATTGDMQANGMWLGATVQVDAMLIPRTLFTLKWAATDLTTATGTQDLGVVTFATKVSY